MRKIRVFCPGTDGINFSSKYDEEEAGGVGVEIKKQKEIKY